MKPYSIQITWIDYDTTNMDDVYKVELFDACNNSMSSWTSLGHAVGTSINIYMSNN